MTVPAAKRLAIRTYQQEKCDRLTVDIPKGKREVYKLVAAELGLSLAALVQLAVEVYAQNHAGEEGVPTSAPIADQPNAKQHESLSAADKRLLDNLNSLPKSTKAKITALVADIAAVAAQEPRQAAD